MRNKKIAAKDKEDSYYSCYHFGLKPIKNTIITQAVPKRKILLGSTSLLAIKRAKTDNQIPQIAKNTHGYFMAFILAHRDSTLSVNGQPVRRRVEDSV